MRHQITWLENVEIVSTFALSSSDHKLLESFAAYDSKTGKTKFCWRVWSHGKVIKRTISFRAAVKAYNAA